MTTRIKEFAVTLDQDYRDDDSEGIRHALEMVKGVLSVEPIEAGISDQMNRTRIRSELGQKILSMLGEA
jgi:hypothetical protein